MRKDKTDINIVLNHGLDGRLFADQRALILAVSLSNLLSPEQRELLEGVNNLCDAIADQAKEQGEDCLLRGSVNHPDLRTHVRQQIIAALPAQLPQGRDELADLISTLLAGDKPAGSSDGGAERKAGGGAICRIPRGASP